MEKRQTEINDKTYQLLLPSPRQAMPLCTKVAVLLGPVLGALGGDVANGGMARFAQAITNVDPDKVDALFMQAVTISKLCCEGQPISSLNDFERHFAQHRADTYRVVVWCLWECVRDFFPQLGAFAQTLKTKAEEFQSQQTGQPTTGSVGPVGQGSAPGKS